MCDMSISGKGLNLFRLFTEKLTFFPSVTNDYQERIRNGSYKEPDGGFLLDDVSSLLW